MGCDAVWHAWALGSNRCGLKFQLFLINHGISGIFQVAGPYFPHKFCVLTYLFWGVEEIMKIQQLAQTLPPTKCPKSASSFVVNIGIFRKLSFPSSYQHFPCTSPGSGDLKGSTSHKIFSISDRVCGQRYLGKKKKAKFFIPHQAKNVSSNVQPYLNVYEKLFPMFIFLSLVSSYLAAAPHPT